MFVKNALPAFKMTKVDGLTKTAGGVTGSGTRFAFDYKGPDTAIAINRLLKDGAKVAFDGASHVAVTGVPRSISRGARPRVYAAAWVAQSRYRSK